MFSLIMSFLICSRGKVAPQFAEGKFKAQIVKLHIVIFILYSGQDHTHPPFQVVLKETFTHFLTWTHLLALHLVIGNCFNVMLLNKFQQIISSSYFVTHVLVHAPLIFHSLI